MSEEVETTNISDTTKTQPDGGAVKPQPEPQQKMFSQVELDATIKDRLTRERQKYADYDELKKAAEKLKGIEDAQKSELEKLQERLAQLETASQQAETENKRLKLQAKVATIAGQLGAVDPHDANFAVATQAIDPDGDGVDEQIKQSIEALKTSKPYLFGQRMPHMEPFNPAEGPGAGARETDTERRGRIYGGGGRVWDPETAKRTGGGVVFPPGWDHDAEV